MTYGGFLEARLTLSAAATFSWTGPSGSSTITVAAGNYYPSALCSTIQTQLAAIGETHTVSLDTAEGGTGRVTIAGGTFSITWTTTALRDALGFTANLSSVTTATGAQSARGVWLPGVRNRFSRYGHIAATAEKGELVTDFRATVSPTGYVHGTYSTKHRRHRGIRWEGVPNNRAKQHHETIVDESFEAFALDCMTGRFSLIPVSPYVRLTWQPNVTTVGKLLWPSTFSLETLVRGWTGRYVVDLPELVEEDA
jgi:hypothetical protein